MCHICFYIARMHATHLTIYHAATLDCTSPHDHPVHTLSDRRIHSECACPHAFHKPHTQTHTHDNKHIRTFQTIITEGDSNNKEYASVRVAREDLRTQLLSTHLRAYIGASMTEIGIIATIASQRHRTMGNAFPGAIWWYRQLYRQFVIFKSKYTKYW